MFIYNIRTGDVLNEDESTPHSPMKFFNNTELVIFSLFILCSRRAVAEGQRRIVDAQYEYQDVYTWSNSSVLRIH